VIVLGVGGNPADSDARAMRVVLGLVNGSERPADGHLVVEVSEGEED